MASAARHSMGGQSLPSDGVAATLAQDWLEPDLANATYRVAAGARWHTVIERLDTLGFSPAVMQSNSDFGIAGTFCVNAHGWPAPFGPFGSTVRSVKIMLADGELVTCSRDENRTLFQASLGGYGLTGIVTELELEMIPNVRLEPDYQVVPAEQFGRRMVDATTMDRAVRMVFGRMNIALDSFMDEAVLVVYRRTADQDGLPSVSRSSIVGRTTREILRRQHDSERMKDLRWWIETELAPALTGGPVTRNSLLSEPVATLANNDPTRTDILHEYFVAPARFADFVAACRQIIPSSYQSLLNVTLRYVAADRDSVLAYAPAPRIAAVMLFSQERTVRAEADMRRMTRTLIDAVLGLGALIICPTVRTPRNSNAVPDMCAFRNSFPVSARSIRLWCFATDSGTATCRIFRRPGRDTPSLTPYGQPILHLGVAIDDPLFRSEGHVGRRW